LKIEPSTAITCVKPSGTVSQLVDSSSGIHARHAAHYIRTVRMDRKDPLTIMMIDMKFPHEEDVTNPHAVVFSFPIQSPDGLARSSQGAIEQLEFWLMYKNAWCEHNPSVTISVKEHEWLAVGAWVYEHFDQMCGVSFLPYTEHTYRQAPYQECCEADYIDFVKKMPTAIDWTELSHWESGDQTTGSQTLACAAGGCEL
jgi:ribonucleoside-triphosphate reductase